MSALAKFLTLVVYTVGFGILFYTLGGWASLALYLAFLLVGVFVDVMLKL